MWKSTWLDSLKYIIKMTPRTFKRGENTDLRRGRSVKAQVEE